MKKAEADIVRGEVVVESLLWSGASVNAFLQKDFGRFANTLLAVNLSVAYGYSHIFSDVPSNELHVKLMYALPRRLQLVATYGIREYDLGRRSRIRYPVTVGVETGYGFLFFHLGVSEEFFVDDAHSFGVAISGEDLGPEEAHPASQRNIRPQEGYTLDDLAKGVKDGRGTVGLLTFGWSFTRSASLFEKEAKTKPTYGPSFTIARGTSDKSSTDDRDELARPPA